MKGKTSPIRIDIDRTRRLALKLLASGEMPWVSAKDELEQAEHDYYMKEMGRKPIGKCWSVFQESGNGGLRFAATTGVDCNSNRARLRAEYMESVSPQQILDILAYLEELEDK